MREAARYTAGIRKFTIGQKIFLILFTLLLIIYFLGELRVLSIPTLTNGGLVPDKEAWLGVFYSSYTALAIYNALIVCGECVVFWAMICLISIFDIYIFGNGANCPMDSSNQNHSSGNNDS